MVAELKSHVLRRDEKGLFGIPFKRLLGAGISAMLIFTIARLVFPVGAIPVGAIGFSAALILSAQRGGLSLYTRLLYRLRGWLIIAATRQPDSFLSRLSDTLDLPTHLVTLDGGQIFVSQHSPTTVDLSQWQTYAAPDEDGAGLVFIERL